MKILCVCVEGSFTINNLKIQNTITLRHIHIIIICGDVGGLNVESATGYDDFCSYYFSIVLLLITVVFNIQFELLLCTSTFSLLIARFKHIMTKRHCS